MKPVAKKYKTPEISEDQGLFSVEIEDGIRVQWMKNSRAKWVVDIVSKHGRITMPYAGLSH
jgi:hypothetical protein